MIQPDTRRWGRYTHNSQVILGLDRKKEYLAVLTSLVAQTVKCLPTMRETPVQSLGWEDLLEKRSGNPFQYSCLENPMERRSLVDYSPWGCKESDTIEQLQLHPVISDQSLATASFITEVYTHKV